MICAQLFCVIKCHQNDCKILNRINGGKRKAIREIQKIKDDLRSVRSFTDWIHISN